MEKKTISSFSNTPTLQVMSETKASYNITQKINDKVTIIRVTGDVHIKEKIFTVQFPLTVPNSFFSKDFKEVSKFLKNKIANHLINRIDFRYEPYEPTHQEKNNATN